jgi:hypothetical protein
MKGNQFRPGTIEVTRAKGSKKLWIYRHVSLLGRTVIFESKPFANKSAAIRGLNYVLQNLGAGVFSNHPGSKLTVLVKDNPKNGHYRKFYYDNKTNSLILEESWPKSNS